jgi:ribosomal protein S24E
MKRQRLKIKNKKIPRKGTQGRHSAYYKIWNDHNPDDLMPDKGFVIHHKDGNPNNNEISNLQKMTDVDHKKLHALKCNHPNTGRKFSKEIRKKLSESHKGQKAWNKGTPMKEEVKEKLRISCKGKSGFMGYHTQETKLKISKANKGKKAWNKGLRKEEGMSGKISFKNLKNEEA